ncbi:hypothetical protein HNQ59_003291 [Chitinivorax tropicus]|uniref:Uncharacterized protein n=1 Tax=Chitinivorax tropicus TaxID=714531 RepID=A0A840MUI2_9PROT|nr:hypothetical protein [Chitinivorax tropicus]MBB5019983.1 hypothetical protein [Chitinivorax tropicus]
MLRSNIRILFNSIPTTTAFRLVFLITAITCVTDGCSTQPVFQDTTQNDASSPPQKESPSNHHDCQAIVKAYIDSLNARCPDENKESQFNTFKFRMAWRNNNQSELKKAQTQTTYLYQKWQDEIQFSAKQNAFSTYAAFGLGTAAIYQLAAHGGGAAARNYGLGAAAIVALSRLTPLESRQLILMSGMESLSCQIHASKLLYLSNDEITLQETQILKLNKAVSNLQEQMEKESSNPTCSNSLGKQCEQPSLSLAGTAGGKLYQSINKNCGKKTSVCQYPDFDEINSVVLKAQNLLNRVDQQIQQLEGAHRKAALNRSTEAISHAVNTELIKQQPNAALALEAIKAIEIPKLITPQDKQATDATPVKQQSGIDTRKSANKSKRLLEKELQVLRAAMASVSGLHDSISNQVTLADEQLKLCHGPETVDRITIQPLRGVQVLTKDPIQITATGSKTIPVASLNGVGTDNVNMVTTQQGKSLVVVLSLKDEKKPIDGTLVFMAGDARSTPIQLKHDVPTR